MSRTASVMIVVTVLAATGVLLLQRGSDDCDSGGVVDRLRDRLRSVRAETRAEAAAALARLGPGAKAAVPDLIEGLSRDNAYWGYTPSCWVDIPRPDHGALVRIGGAAVPELTKALAHENRDIRAGAALVLGEIGSAAASAVSALAGALSDPEGRVRQCAAAALGQMGTVARAAVPALIRALDDPWARFRATGALGAVGADPKEAVPALIALIDDPDEYVRLNVVDSIASFGPSAKQAVPALVARLPHDKETGVARHAADALRSIGPAAREAVPALIRELNAPRKQTDEEFHYLVSVAAALVVIEPSSTAGADVLRKAVTGDHGHYTLIAAEALLDARMDEDGLAAEALAQLVCSTLYPEGRVRAALRLGRLGARARLALPALDRARNDTAEIVSKAATHAMTDIREAIRGIEGPADPGPQGKMTRSLLRGVAAPD